MRTTLKDSVDKHLPMLTSAIHEAAKDISTTTGLSFQTSISELVAHLKALGDVTHVDGRAALWRVRLRFYDMAGDLQQPLADSDPTLDGDQPGAVVLSSLNNVMSWIAEMATAYHGGPCAGMHSEALARPLRALRTQLSNRRDGTGTMKVRYTALHHGSFGAVSEKHMLARCDVVREAAPVRDAANISI